MRRKGLLRNRILALGLSTALVFSCMPGAMVSGNTLTNVTEQAVSENADEAIQFTLGEKASYVDNGKNGQAIKISTSWISSSKSMGASATISNADIFKKEAFTFYVDVYRQVISTSSSDNDADGDGRNVAFSVGTGENYFKICLAQKGSLRFGHLDEKSSAVDTVVEFSGNTTEENKWNSLIVSYSETNGVGAVTVYIEGKKVIDNEKIGFALSELTDIKANIGAGFGTGFMGKGLYDNIRIEDAAVTEDTIDIANRYTEYSTFSGAADGILCSGDVNVNEWLDTNGEHIQAHGGQVQWLDTLDLDEDGIPEGGWIWYGEDKTRNGKPIDGIHCYTSPDLYNWTDCGIVLATHDVVPDKLNAAEDGIETNTVGLANLKAWAEMEAATEEVTQENIDMAKAFIDAYKTENGYDEDNLAKAFKYLYSGYCIAERPKMLYNESTKQYVLVYHVDGPSDANILKYLQDGTFPSRYTRAMMGFAVSDTPYGPFKLVNAQRMNYKTGEAYTSSPGMARDMTVFKDDTDVDKNGVADAYAIYSSEDNKYTYISLLNAAYTAPATEANKDTMTLADGTEILTFAERVYGSDTWREAPAIFKYNGYYYMITSGTTGWMANPAGYYRSQNIYGPYESMGDPCEGGSDDTFGSQPTAVIPVDVERGKFIYMGDRWSYTITDASKGSSGTDSAHWDSGYVWLPIEINDDNTIVLPNISNWDLSIMDNVKINTELPKVISSIEDLPAKLNVTVDAGTFDSSVEWDTVETEYFTDKRITGTLTDLDNRSIAVTVKMAPENMVYFVDAGAASTTERDKYIKDMAILKNSTIVDQAYSVENTWGHVGENTSMRETNNENIYETLRYPSTESNTRDIIYQFDNLKAANYSIYVGLFEPSSWYSSTRIAKVSVKQGNTVLKASEESYGSKGSAGHCAVFENLDLNGMDNIQVVISPKNTGKDTDIQISFIAIVDNSIQKDEEGGNPGGNEEDKNPEDGEEDKKPEDGEENKKPDSSEENKTPDSSEGDKTPADGNEDGKTPDNSNGGEVKPDNSENKNDDNQILAEKVTLNTKKLYIVKGQSIKLKAVMTPADTTDTLNWTSSKNSVATVANGKIKAKKVGNANITVTTSGGKKAVCKVYVVKKAKKSSSVKLNKKKASIKAGSWMLLTPTLKPAKSTDTIKWKSSNKKIASVDAYGFVTAKKKGKATITATTKNGKKATCKITVK